MHITKTIYQVSQEEIIDNIHFENKDNIPKIILCIAPVRSGTKASLRVFGESGITSFNQPIKTIFRNLAKGGDGKAVKWMIPNEEVIYIKETVGPFNMEEVNLNPVEILFQLFLKNLKDKVPETELQSSAIQLMQKKLHVVIMGRCPLDSWYSNRKLYVNFAEKTLKLQNEENWYYDLSISEFLLLHLTAYETVNKMAAQSKDLKLNVNHFVMETYKKPLESFHSLFKKIGLDKIPAIDNWSNKSSLEKSDSFVKESQDNMQRKSGIFHAVNTAKGISYCEGKGHLLAEDEKQQITLSPVTEIYKTWVQHTEEDLNIKLR